jgi:hypothetical protein
MLGRDCLVHARHDEVVPIQYHHVRPLPRGGGESPVISLCANAHGRVHALLDNIETYAAACPYATLAEVLAKLPAHVTVGYQNTEKAIAARGWESYGTAFLNGRYRTAFRWWATDGRAKADEVPHYCDLFHASRWSRRWRRELDAS